MKEFDIELEPKSSSISSSKLLEFKIIINNIKFRLL